MHRLLFAVALPLLMAAAEIPPGTHVLLRMVNSINTRTAQPGDRVYLRTASPIAVDGRILVPVDSYVQGAVTHSKRSGRIKGKAQLAIRLESLTLPRGATLKFAPKLDSVDAGDSGQKVDKTESMVNQSATKGEDAKTIAILAGSGASVGALVGRDLRGAGIGAGVGAGVGLATVLLGRGREVELRQGTTLDVVLDRPVLLEP
ncbi:MAG: hypothetical protein GY953_00305 [bacterium]|nr:hypothetical protein [bacterium]